MNKIISTSESLCPPGIHHLNTHFYDGSIYVLWVS